MNTPNPALVTQRAVQRLPRIALLLFCAAYVVPGVFGRDPWKNADIEAFGAMVSIAQRGADVLAPTVGGVAAKIAPLPHALGALFIYLLQPVLDPAVAARIPFALLLVLTLTLTWYATFHLARTDAAQPLPLAFGGEANTVDYARAIADGAVLALIASLGLLQLGHETTPELVQLAAVALFLYALAASPFRQLESRAAALAALPVLASSGAPVMALVYAGVGIVVALRSSYAPVRRLVPWIAAAGALATAAAFAFGAWQWRLRGYDNLQDVVSLLRLLAWFTWPAWPLALWTLWRWRAQIQQRHIAVPLGTALVGVGACVAAGASDRALMLSLPAIATLAAFALPTLKRNLSAVIDWFSVCFFSIAALAIWVVYAAMQTGVPAKPAANVMRLAPGFVPSFSALALLCAAAGTLAWLWLVRWRTGRHQEALWKSLVLPASGVALCWLLLMTLWLPLLDYARSLRPLVSRIAQHVPREGCVAAIGLSRAQLAALEYFGGYRVDGRPGAERSDCRFLLLAESSDATRPAAAGWVMVARERRPTDREDTMTIYRRGKAPR